MTAKSRDRRSLVLQRPEILRKAVAIAGVSALVLLLNFGLDLAHRIFLREAGTSVLSPLVEFLNSSLVLRLLVLAVWGWVIFDFALHGGAAVTSAPFPRFIRHMDEIPAKLVEFKMRERDQEFADVATAYNLMVERLHQTRDMLFSTLDRAEKESWSIDRIRSSFATFLSSPDNPVLRRHADRIHKHLEGG